MLRFSKNHGFSLIEVLISLLLISLILFGLDAGQFFTIKEANYAYFFSTAENQIRNGVQRLVALKGYEALDEQEANWNAENQKVLPQGWGIITGAFPNYTLSIYWGNIPHRCEKQKLGSSGCLTKKIYLE